MQRQKVKCVDPLQPTGWYSRATCGTDREHRLRSPQIQDHFAEVDKVIRQIPLPERILKESVEAGQTLSLVFIFRETPCF